MKMCRPKALRRDLAMQFSRGHVASLSQDIDLLDGSAPCFQRYFASSGIAEDLNFHPTYHRDWLRHCGAGFVDCGFRFLHGAVMAVG